MSKPKSLVGIRFGKQTVTAELGGGYVEIQCDCGTIKRTRKQYITSGESRSCGCGRYDSERPVCVGDVFDRLTVEQVLGSNGHKREVLCLCSCGLRKVVFESDLRSGSTSSCGCIRRERMGALNRKHGDAGTKRTYLYRAWESMRTRCSNPERYPSYARNGISVDPLWNESFEAFRAYVNEELGERPDGYSLDRIVNSGNYEPGNLRWATSSEQGCNRSNNILITANGVTKCVAEWARDLGCKPPTIHARIRNGWTPENAVTTSVARKTPKPRKR